MNVIFRTICTLVIAFSSTVTIADVAIISNPDDNIGEIDTYNVKNIFLGERKSFPNGLNANPVNQTQGSPARKIFFHNILGITEQAHESHWLRKLKKRSMRTTAHPPEEAGSYTDVLKTVANTTGAIGYIDASMVNDSVKVLMTIKTSVGALDGNIVANK